MRFKSALIIASLLAATFAGATERLDVVKGRIQITTTEITVQNLGSFPLDLKTVQCFDTRGERTTCETLAGIGYADSARITFVANKVRRIDLVELQQ